MCHATKKIKCDMDDDEYFENHYQFSQGLFSDDDEEECDNEMLQTVLFSKCQKDPLSTDAEYKHRKVLLTVEGEYCARCETITPLSLKILSCNEILKHKEITMVAVSLLPGNLIKFLMKVGPNNPEKYDWDVIKTSISVLLEYWPYTVLDLTTLTDKGWFQVALTHLVLDRFAAEINSHALQQKSCRNQLTEFVMRTSDELGEPDFYDNLHRKLFSTVWHVKRRGVFDHVEPTMKYIIITDIHIRTEEDLNRILYLLRLCRKPGSPFEVRIINWHVQAVNISALAKISQEINPEIVKSFSTIIKPKEILKLDEMLKPSVELTSLSLTLFAVERNDALRQKLANDFSLLIGHHPTLKRLFLRHFKDLLVGYGNNLPNKYPLPTSLETLVLYDSVLTHWTDASTTSHIRDLTIYILYFYGSPSDVEGCLKFVESQAETLVSLDINLCKNNHQPTVDRLKRMAERLAQFYRLQRFTYHVQNGVDLSVMLLDILPLIAINPSLNSYILNCECSPCDRNFLQLAMKTICLQRRRLFDFALLTFNGHVGFNGIPIVGYEDLWKVADYDACKHSPDDFDCNSDIDEDFAIREYKDAYEAVGLRCHLPADYD